MSSGGGEGGNEEGNVKTISQAQRQEYKFTCSLTNKKAEWKDLEKHILT